MPKRPRTVARRRKPREPSWVRLPDDELLKRRFCDLRLTLRDSFMHPYLEQLQHELEHRGLNFKPHVWLSEEWFSPDGIPGIALPFYIAHPRLMQLERHQMNEVEGGNANWLMRILRHEAGHAIDNAFRLRRRKDWRRTFGRASRPYPRVYKPRPASRRFVLHLGHWYSQSHPTEDFAETFAVWLQPRSRWRTDYAEWPALKKLEYVDSVMAELAGQRPPVRSREVIEPLSENRRTLLKHYRDKLDRYQFDAKATYDRRLKLVFGVCTNDRKRLAAGTLLRQARPQMTRWLARRTRLHPYVINHVVRTVIQRCRDLDLVVVGSKREATRRALGLMERIMIDVLRRDREKYTL
jgi:hypothetical protein